MPTIFSYFQVMFLQHNRLSVHRLLLTYCLNCRFIHSKNCGLGVMRGQQFDIKAFVSRDAARENQCMKRRKVHDEGNYVTDFVMCEQSLIFSLTTSGPLNSQGQAICLIMLKESCQFILADAEIKTIYTNTVFLKLLTNVGT